VTDGLVGRTPGGPIPDGVSHEVRRALTGQWPRWRGRLHRVAIPLSAAAGVLLVLSAPVGRDRVGAAIFTVGAVTLFSVSGLVHLRRWRVPLWEVLYRCDHAAIFLLIATCATPLALSALDGGAGRLMLWAVWIGAALGIAMRLLPFHPPKGLMNTLFIVLGWVPVVVAPSLISALEPPALALVGLEGLLYVAGALMLGARWPRLWPAVFGYHEVWHTLVVLAVAAHFVVVFLIVHP